MLQLIEALDFRCLRNVRQEVGPFQVLVGPNASGKTTFLDVVAFLGDLIRDGGPERAIQARTESFRDLVWQRRGDGFELAIEAKIPEERSQYASPAGFDRVRYEVRLELDTESNQIGIAEEHVLLVKPPGEARRPALAPGESLSRDSLLRFPQGKEVMTIISKERGKHDTFYSEKARLTGAGGRLPPIRLGPRRSALSNMLWDEDACPAATWLKQLLTEGVQTLGLDSKTLRAPSPPGLGKKTFHNDGSNLPWVVEDLVQRFPERHADWLEHVRTALPDIRTIRTVERAEDRKRYLMLEYEGGFEVPSWAASDGTLRMLALTLIAYLPDFRGIYLVEEPENGIHPRAVETVFQALSSAYDAQILVATHSPVILGCARPEQVLCFTRTGEGATSMVLGHEHPALREWRGDPNMSVLFAAGVLGWPGFGDVERLASC